MARGGKREGAGRKKGVPNQKTRERLEAICREGLTPLEYMLQVLRDENETPARRDEMAKAAAPYVHPKLSATTLSGDQDKPLIPSRIEVVVVKAGD